MSAWAGLARLPCSVFQTQESIMSLVIDANPVPLRTDDEGVVRVTGTRVSLDTIVEAYHEGETPETISDQYPSLAVRDIYAIIAYYLGHRQEVDAYLAERGEQREQLRREILEWSPQDGIRERLLARRDSR
jgi:uncharacterized protein (DUF433 family)